MKLEVIFNRFILTGFILLVFNAKSSAQFASQEELKKTAETYFVQEEYDKALPLYTQLLSNYPKDPDYNFRYGTCYFFANRDKEGALKYLNFATSKPNINPQAFYFLALALHHEYQFSAAESNYNKFRQLGLAKDIQEFQVDRKIEMCRNGATLLKSMTDIGVLQKKEIKTTEFFRSYDLKGIGGKVVVKPDEFKTKYDIKKKESSIVHIGDNANMVVFSSYGNDGKNGKDIFKVVKLPNGEWSNPSVFPDINTKFDEDYPFLHPDGQTLYFSSKGYNSMGGYDIFKSTFDANTGRWSSPENIDFPINTPDDDILFISDIDNQLAYFASSRASKLGELTVYKVKVDRVPSENTIVKGIFIAESNPNQKSATISILDTEKNKKYGVFTTQKETGEYVLVFPGNGGKFKLLVETTNTAPVHSAVVELPQLDGFRALKQELRLVGEGSSEKLVVKNLFDESDEFDFNDPLIVENLLKYKAKMDVNISEDEISNNTAIANKTSLEKFSNEELKSESQKTNTKLTENAKLSKSQANFSYDLAMQKATEAKQLFVQSEQQKKIASESQVSDEKIAAFSKSEQLKLDAAKLVNESVAAINIAKSLESEAVERESDIKKSNELNQTVSSKILAGNRKDAEIAYNELAEIVDATYNKESAVEKEKELATKKLEEKEIQFSKTRNKALELSNRQNEINEQIDALTIKLNKSSKKSEKEAFQSEIDALKIDLEDAKYDLGVALDEEKKLNNELAEIRNSTTTTENILDEVGKVTTNTTSKIIDKTALNNEIAFFEKQGLVGLYPTTTVETKELASSFDLTKQKENYTIISDDGKVIDYSTKHCAKMVDAQQLTTEPERSTEMAAIHNLWVADIKEELEIRQKQLESTSNLNDKTKLQSRIEVLKNLQTEKQKEADKYSLLAQQNSPDNTSTTTITDSNGNITNYNQDFEKKITALDSKENSKNVIQEKIKVYEEWNKAGNQELLLKKIELNNAEGEDKLSIESRIVDLNDQIKNNNEYIALYTDKLNEFTETKSNSTIATTATENKDNSKTTNTPIDYSKYDSKIISSNGEVADYSTDFNSQLSKSDGITDPLLASKEKEKITQEWIEAVSQEIEYRNDLLARASENEKPEISRKIAELKSEKTSLTEQLSDIQLVRTQQESMLASKSNTQNQPTNLNSEISSKNSSAAVETTNGDFYVSENAKKEFLAINSQQSDLDRLKQQLEQKSVQASQTTNEAEKTQLVSEISNIENQIEQKEIEIAQTIEKSNKAEYYNNQEILSKYKPNQSSTDNNLMIAEMKQDEAVTYFEKAQEEREKAANIQSDREKKQFMTKAGELEKTAIEKQKNAIEIYKNSSVELAVSTEKQQSLPSNTNTPDLKSEHSNNNIKNQTLEIENLTEDEKQVLATLSPIQIEEIKSSPEYKEYQEAKNSSRRLYKEAEVDYVQAAKFEEEANDQKILDNSLSKMAEATTDEAAKTKLKGQLVKLANMIKENEAKSLALNTQAASKKNEAEASNIKAEQIVSNKSNAKEIKAIEKAESNNVDLTAMINNRKSSEPNNTNEENNTLAANQQNTTNQPALNNTESTNSNLDNKQQTPTSSENENTITEQNSDNSTVTTENTSINQETTDSNQNQENNSLSIPKNENVNNTTENTEKAVTTTENSNTEEIQPIDNNKNVESTQNSSKLSTSTESNNAEQTASNNTNTQNNQSETVLSNQQQIPLSKINEIPDVLTSPIFVLTPNNSPVYSETNKIPATTKLPEGLIFKVQIGAFRNPIPQDHFRGFAPIMTEDAGNGITRYTAGLFNTFNMANEAKNAIRTIGYPDAFVVAFYNGKRININEARAMASGGAPIASNESIETNATSNQNTNNQVSSLVGKTTKIPETRTNVELVNDGRSTDVNKIKGVFFTVQVGVYSKPITSEQLNNVTPLNSEKTQNGLIRYTSGNYKNINDATIAKDRIKGMGITDAFVVAYANGNRVSVNDALSFIANENQTTSNPVETNETTSSQTPNTITNPTTNTNSTNTSIQTTQNNTETPGNNQPKEPINQKEIGEKLNLVFKVLLGEYEEEVPVDEAAVYLKIQSRGVKISEENNKTIYSIGEYPDYPSALDMQIEMKTEGVKKPKVIAFKNGTPIEVNEALELVKNNK